MELLVIVLIAGLTFGAVGVAIANNKNVDGLVGFLLGAFLGPLGLIIVALLNPSAAASTKSTSPNVADSPPCERDLTLDAYQLWLAAKYDVKKNDLFGRFVLLDQTFGDLEEALTAAHAIEEAHLAKLAEQEDERRLRREKADALEKIEAAKSADFLRKIKVPALTALALILGLLAYSIFYSSKHHEEMLLRHRANIENIKNSLRSELSKYGISELSRDGYGIGGSELPIIYSSEIDGSVKIEPDFKILRGKEFFNPSFENSPSRNDFDQYGQKIAMCNYNESQNYGKDFKKIDAGGRFIRFYIWDSRSPLTEIESQLETNGYKTSWIGIREIREYRTLLNVKSGNYANIYVDDKISDGPNNRVMRVDLCFGKMAIQHNSDVSNSE